MKSGGRGAWRGCVKTEGTGAWGDCVKNDGTSAWGAVEVKERVHGGAV